MIFRSRQTLRLVATTVLFGMGLWACAEPDIPVTDTTHADTAGEQPEQFDPLGDALTEAVNTLVTAVEQVQTLINVTSTDTAVLHAAADAALTLLLDADVSVFPKPRVTAERDTASDDLLSQVLTAARQVGGARGGNVTAAVSDSVAGDLGAWERDPDGMRQQALTAFGDTIETTADAVGLLEADGMRAIAWLAFAKEQNAADTIRTAFVNASVHLDIVLLSVAAAHL